jgi:streptogramin lyase
LKGDPPAARSPLTPAYPLPDNANAQADRGGRGARRGAALPPGQVPLTAMAGPVGEGGQGMEYRDGLLYFAVLPTRRVYVLDPKTWQVQTMWQVAGARSHGVGWEGDTLWVADSNLRAFFWHDMKTGEIVEKIQLTEKDPLIHGVTVHDGYLWYCDDVGYICNFKL